MLTALVPAMVSVVEPEAGAVLFELDSLPTGEMDVIFAPAFV